MAEKFYYIKHDSGVKGPFHAHQIIEMIEEQLLSKDVMISENRIYWNTAEEVLKLKKEEAPKTVAFPQPSRPRPAENNSKSAVILKEYETAVPFILPQTVSDKSAHPKAVPDPVSATFSMIWNAPEYLKNMYMIFELYPDRSNETVKYSAYTLILCMLTEFIMAITLFGLFLRKYFLPVMIAIVLIMLCQMLLIFLENLCMAAIARRKKLFEPPVLIMQMQSVTFTTFMTALPLSALLADTHDTISIVWKIIVSIFCFASAIAGMANMNWGLFRAMTDIFDFQLTSKISLIMLNTVQWLLLTAAIFNLAKIFTKIL